MSSIHIVCPSCSTTNRIDSKHLQDKPKCGKCKQSLFNHQPLPLNAANFDKHIQGNDIPVVVDFWADWCGPCKMMAPAFTQAASQLEPLVRFAKLNTEQEQAIATKYAIRSIPTLILFKHGRQLANQAGAMSATDIVNWIKQNMTG